MSESIVFTDQEGVSLSWQHYALPLKKNQLADLRKVGVSREAGSFLNNVNIYNAPNVPAALALFKAVIRTTVAKKECLIKYNIYITESIIYTASVDKNAAKVFTSFVVGLDEKSLSSLLQALAQEAQQAFVANVAELEDLLDDLDQDFDTDMASVSQDKLAFVRRDLIAERRIFSPVRDGFNRLLLSPPSWVTAPVLEGVKMVMAGIAQSLKELDSMRERAIIIQEQLTTHLSAQLDRRMYFLTVVSIIFLPLSFITGLLGVNVGGIPGLTYRNGFWVLCGILFVVLIFEVLFLKRKKWFG